MPPPRAWLRGEGEDAVSSGSAHIVVSSPNIERLKILGVERPGRARILDEQGKEGEVKGGSIRSTTLYHEERSDRGSDPAKYPSLILSQKMLLTAGPPRVLELPFKHPLASWSTLHQTVPPHDIGVSDR